MTIKFKLNGDWNEVSRMLKKQYPFLSGHDLAFIAGGEDHLVARLSATLKLPLEEVRALLLKLKVKAASGEAINEHP